MGFGVSIVVIVPNADAIPAGVKSHGTGALAGAVIGPIGNNGVPVAGSGFNVDHHSIIAPDVKGPSPAGRNADIAGPIYRKVVVLKG